MKPTRAFAVIVTLIGISACGQNDRGGVSYFSHDFPVLTHYASACPMINGTYGPAASDKQNVIQTEKIPDGVRMKVGSREWIINGKNQTTVADDGSKTSYIGYCHENVVSIDLYPKDDKPNRMSFSQDSSKSEITATTIIPGHGGPGSRETWVEKPSP